MLFFSIFLYTLGISMFFFVCEKKLFSIYAVSPLRERFLELRGKNSSFVQGNGLFHVKG
jgi:hypothetical protein